MSDLPVDPRAGPRWDPARYERFKAERARPFFELLARVEGDAVRRVADLGCGTGELTRALCERWPEAEVWGVDSSEEMLARGAAAPTPPSLRFVREDLARWVPPAPLDRIVSNAALHWVPDHASLLERLVAFLAPEGVIGVQLPNNRAEPAYRVVREMLEEAPWAERLPAGYRASIVESAAWYDATLRRLGMDADVWETIYYHRLDGPADVVEWLSGSTLRPALTGVADGVTADFLAALAERIALHYPPGPNGVVFPFRRLFFVARRSRPRGGE